VYEWCGSAFLDILYYSASNEVELNGSIWVEVGYKGVFIYVPPVSVTKSVSKRSCLFIGEVPWYFDLRPLSGTSNSMVVMRNGRG